MVPGVKFNFHLSLLQLLVLLIIGVFGALMVGAFYALIAKLTYPEENFFTLGMTLEKDNIAVYMAYLQAVLALVVDALVWGNLPDLGSLIGSFLIVSALLVVEKHKIKKQDLGDIEMACRAISLPAVDRPRIR